MAYVHHGYAIDTNRDQQWRFDDFLYLGHPYRNYLIGDVVTRHGSQDYHGLVKSSTGSLQASDGEHKFSVFGATTTD